MIHQRVHIFMSSGWEYEIIILIFKVITHVYSYTFPFWSPDGHKGDEFPVWSCEERLTICLVVAKLRQELSFPDSPSSVFSLVCQVIQYNTIQDDEYRINILYIFYTKEFSLSFNVLPMEKYYIPYNSLRKYVTIYILSMLMYIFTSYSHSICVYISRHRYSQQNN